MPVSESAGLCINMTDQRIRDLETIMQVFDKFGVNFSIVYGVTLGFYRDGDFLPGDEDMDLAVTEKPDLETRKKIGWALYDLGFKPQAIAFNVFGRMEPGEIGYNGDENTGIIVCERNFKFTIFFFEPKECDQHGFEYVCTPKLGAMKLISSPMKFYEKFKTIKIGGKKYNIPSPIEDYLNFTYFNNWKDKTDRRHGLTFQEMHAKESLNEQDANSVMIEK